MTEELKWSDGAIASQEEEQWGNGGWFGELLSWRPVEENSWPDLLPGLDSSTVRNRPPFSLLEPHTGSNEPELSVFIGDRAPLSEMKMPLSIDEVKDTDTAVCNHCTRHWLKAHLMLTKLNNKNPAEEKDHLRDLLSKFRSLDRNEITWRANWDFDSY